MLGSWSKADFPNLVERQNCAITSQATPIYNCISWSVGEEFRWWWPDGMLIGYWPAGVTREETFSAFLEAYATLGFKLCYDGSLEPGLEKLVLFGTGKSGQETPTHAALQLASGEWTSKLGVCEDISHQKPEDLTGPCYGRVVCYLSRPRP